MSDSSERVGVVGGGQMGAGIAEVCARAGVDVVVCEADQGLADAAEERLSGSLERAVERGKLEADQLDAVSARLSFTADLDALADRTFVVEAIVENEAAKTKVFARLDKVVAAQDAVLATNTSSIPIMRIARATQRPESVLGVHFFNPVPVMRLVELIPCLLTGEDAKRKAEQFVSDALGKQPIWCADQAGFVVNALLVPYLLSAIRMCEAGVATADDIDTGMVEGCGHPMGPLRLTDLIGLDTTLAVAQSLYAEFRQAQYAPPPLLARMVEAGLLGRKAGRGFYDYRG